MSKKKISIAIDGPAAAGKSTVAKLTAEKLSYVYVDTGAMYRALTYKAITEQVDIHNEEQLKKLLPETKIELKPSENGQLVILDGNDVTAAIREAVVTNKVSIVAASRAVREEMVSRQQQLGQNGGVVMDGRDIGTSVLPKAELKIFMLASVEIRAQRRHQENISRGFSSDMSQLMKEIELRDKSDMEREVSPLVKAADAIEIDTSNLSIDEVAHEIMKLAQERIEAQ
ncbi:(d)CMP kinase [Lederbergia lenta]|uniref:Cytidylate kinase n=1 Tax=Lederbergia lenta TaxID=1467 RepID=A0A2X4VW84_LEDLE|nr:(d)CMP kinase [Lederbergia lenta]MCM3111632.1 (d)CMP kinase [Lederbergia lenta]MEC2324976.1 (d)CMP kinase [Lederbergia lenta]SQI56527.1 cytidylate kinase [Lederbergia lenta]